MNRSYTWQAFIVLFLTVLCIARMYALGGKTVVPVGKEGAANLDTKSTTVVSEADRLERDCTGRTFANLREVVGTNYITNYFPRIAVAGKKDPTRHVLQRLQQDTRGKFRLGLDLQGGTSFLVEMQTNTLGEVSHEVALERSIEVLRARVDKLGVAEPLIQPSGNNRILVQLPGLAEVDKQSARENIQKAAFLE